MAMGNGKGLGLRELIMILSLFLILVGLTVYSRSNSMIVNLSGIGLGLSLFYIGHRLDDFLRSSGGADGSDEGVVSDDTHDIAYQIKPGSVGALRDENHDYQVNRLTIG